MNSKGYLIVATKNTSGHNYLRHAVALAASIKNHCGYNSVCLVTDYAVPKKWRPLFDHITAIDNQPTAWTQNILSRVYDLSPYHETIHIEADCLVQSDLDHWWSGCQHHDILFTGQVRDIRGNWARHDYRSHFDRSNLPKIYTGVYYFRKSARAKKIHNTMAWVVSHWSDIKDMIFDPNQKINMGNDEVAAVALALSNLLPEEYLNNHLPYPTFCHMKPKINQWAELDLTQALGIFLDDNFDLRVNNYTQTGIWHYHYKSFLTDEILDRYVASVL